MKLPKFILDKMYKDIITKTEFPKVGEPTTRCNECAFSGKQCNPGSLVTGCFHGWKV